MEHRPALTSGACVEAGLRRLAGKRFIIHGCAYLALVLVHLFFAFQIRYPTVFYDEIVYLGFARYFSGRAALPNLIGGGYGHFGYGLLVAPAFLFSSVFPTQFRIVLIINCVLISTCYISVYFLIVKLTQTPWRVCVIISVVTCLYPPYLLFSNFAISENAFVPLGLLVIVAVVLLLERPSLARGLLLGASAGFCYTVHSRGLAVAVAAVVLVGVGSLYRRVPWSALAVVMVTVGGFYLVTRQAMAHILEVSRGAVPSLSGSLGPLATRAGWKAVLLVLAGQGVYFAAGTFSLYFAGAACILSDVMRPAEGSRWVSRYALSFVAATVVVVWAGAAVFIAPQDIYNRPDHLLIGRYSEGVAPTVLAFALVLLYRAAKEAAWKRCLWKTVWATSLSICTASLLLEPYVHKLGLCTINALGTVALVDVFGPPSLARVTLLSVVLSSAVLMFHHKYGSKVIGLVGVMLTVGAVSVSLTHYRQSLAGDGHPAVLTRLLPDIRGASEIDYDMSVWQPFLYSSYQLMAPRLHFVQFSSANGQKPTSGVVIAGAEWKDAESLGYRYVAGEEIADNSLWVSSPDLWKDLVGRTSFLAQEVGSRVVRGIRTVGVYAEQGDERTRLRWTNGEARIMIPIWPGEIPRHLAVELFAFDKTRTTLLVNGEPALRLDVGPGSVFGEIALHQEGSPASLVVEIRSNTFAPGRGDPRTLGVQIRSLKALP